MDNDSRIICPNCENSFEGKYSFCPHCGQANKKLNLDLKHIVSELLAANFNLESKFVVTLRLLITKPAFLTREYLMGKRTKYLNPIRLYLLVSFVFFFVSALDFGNKDGIVKWNNDNVVTADNIDSLKVSELQSEDKYDTVLSPIFHDSINQKINEAVPSYDSIFTVADSLYAEEEDSDFDQYVERKAKVLSSDHGKEKLNELFSKYLSVGMFVLIPLTALLLFWIFHKGTYYFQHLIFTFHLQSLIFIVFTLFQMVAWFMDNDIVDSIFSISLLIIIYIWLKKNYRTGYFKTFWKMLVFFATYAVLLMLFFAGVGIISIINLG